MTSMVSRSVARSWRPPASSVAVSARAGAERARARAAASGAAAGIFLVFMGPVTKKSAASCRGGRHLNENGYQMQTIRVCERSIPVVARPHARIVDLDGKLRHRLIGGRAERATVAHVELRTVQGAFDRRFVAIEVASGQLEILMRALVFNRVEVAVVVHHEDGGVAVPRDDGFAGKQLRRGADEYPIAH